VKRHLRNSAYGVLDYAAYPIGMLAVAPIVIHKIGTAEYGLWTIATAIISAGGIVSSGFCNANIQRIASLRSRGETSSMVDAVRSMLAINLMLGGSLALIAWIASPYAARHIAGSNTDQVHELLLSLRIASAAILARAVEALAVSTHRAFEHYRETVQISTAVRILTLASAAVLALAGHRSVSILFATAAFLVLGTFLQFRRLIALFGIRVLWPRFRSDQTSVLLRLGVFSWLQAVAGVVFGQLDRVMLGISLGAVAVAPYSLCVQFSQPIVELTASALQILFPYLSGRLGEITTTALKQVILRVFLCNLLLVAGCAGFVLLVGESLIRLSAGNAVAHTAAQILPAIVLGSALAGLSTTATYALLALGLFRTVTLVTLSGRTATFLLMLYLLRHEGLRGLATVRVCYGLLALLVYLPLLRSVSIRNRAARSMPLIAGLPELQEGSKS
jgi:O-antigen/teichoic acid export membrane protein